MSSESETDKYRLGSLQLEIMDVLWRLGEANVAAVREGLTDANRDLAYTTVATMLSKMEKKGVVGHRCEGRVFIYFPTVQRRQVAQAMTDELLDGVFGGSPTQLVSHLLERAEVRDDEISAIKELIRRKEAQRGRSSQS